MLQRLLLSDAPDAASYRNAVGVLLAAGAPAPG